MKKLISFFALTLLIGGFATSSHAQDTTFHPGGKLWMQMFMDYENQLSADTASAAFTTPSAKPAKQGSTYYDANSGVVNSVNTKAYQMFDIRRLYLGYDYNISRDVSASMLLAHETGNVVTNTVITSVATIKNSAGQDSSVLKTSTASNTPTTGSGDILLDGKYGVYLKAANFQFKNWVPMATVIIGQQSTAAFSVAEMLWGYRSIEKTVADMRGLAQSTDLGINLAGKFDADKNYGYSVFLANGQGAKEDATKFKQIMLDVNGMFLDKHIVVDVYFDDIGLTDSTSRSTIKGTVGYTSDPFTVGLEYVTQTSTKSGLANPGGASALDANPTGLSVFAHATILDKKLSVFARYDMFDPDAKATASAITASSAGNAAAPWGITQDWKENFITAGLDWQPTSDANAHIMPNIWMDTFSDKSSNSISRMGITVARVTFAYKF